MSLKKAELHVHLEGTIRPELATQLAKRNRLKIPEGLVAPDGVSYLSKNFLDFLNAYDKLAALIKHPRDYYDITFDYLRTNALDDAIYVEMMYSPDHAEYSSGIPSVEHLIAIQQAIDDAQHQYNIVGRIILTAVRHFGVDAVEAVARQAHKDKLPCITGFGLGGDEAKFPPKLFAKAYEIAVDAGLECTVHAGEFAPAAGMVEAMENLPIKRIGHGVNSIYSPETMMMVKERGIALEICPTSNIFLGLFKNMDSHPFPKFYQAGINISINSDDPPFMSTTLAQEYQRVQKAYQYSDEIMNNITKMAINSAFVDEKTRNQLLELDMKSLALSCITMLASYIINSRSFYHAPMYFLIQGFPIPFKTNKQYNSSKYNNRYYFSSKHLKSHFLLIKLREQYVNNGLGVARCPAIAPIQACPEKGRET